MIEIDQDLQALADYFVRFATFDIRDEADATGVMFIARVIKALCFWQSHVIALERPRSRLVVKDDFPGPVDKPKRAQPVTLR